MEKNQIRDISLGALAAENDDYLERYFFENKLFRRVEAGFTKILIGSRGSGKSAIFRMLAKQEKSRGNLVQEIIPTDYMYDLLKNTRRFDSDAEWARLGAYTASWKYAMLITAMKMLYTRHKKDKAHAGFIAQIKAFLRENQEEQFKDPIDLLISFIKRFGNISKLSLEGIQFHERTDQMEKLYKLESIQPLLPAVSELSAKTPVMLLFDELDHGWDASNDARQFIAGLFRAAIQINRQFRHINVLITIREEIYQNIPELYTDAQKIRDIIEHIRWTPLELKEMLAQRIRHAFEFLLEIKIKNTDADKLWGRLFETELTPAQISPFDYIVSRTLHRPRELIFFVNECLKTHNLQDKIGLPTIQQVERYYSMNRIEDIASEYRFQYPGLREVFETFRLSPAVWERTKLEEHWLEIIAGNKCCPEANSWLNETAVPHKLIEILWKVGFLRAFLKTDAHPDSGSGVDFVGYFQEPTLNIAMLRLFDIHPMFRPHLGIYPEN